MPGSREMPLKVILPKENAIIYTDVDQKQLENNKNNNNQEQENINNTNNNQSTFNITDSNKIVYKVKSGDNLSKIAEKYKTTVNNIMEWNNLSSTLLQINQELIIYKK